MNNPRSVGHTAISTITHYQDMSEAPIELNNKIFEYAKQMMNILKEVYQCERVYLCSMCDGPTNHYHIQLIPRYIDEIRGSKNFVKPRKEYIFDEDKFNKVKTLINEYKKK